MLREHSLLFSLCQKTYVISCFLIWEMEIFKYLNSIISSSNSNLDYSLNTYGISKKTIDKGNRNRVESINWWKGSYLALTSMVQWIGRHSSKQKVASSIPGQGTCLGCWFSPWAGHVPEAMDQCFSLTSMFLSLPSPFSKNKQIKILKRINIAQGSYLLLNDILLA